MSDVPGAGRLKAEKTYDAAADDFDAEPLAFWDRYGRRTIERLRLEPGANVLDVCCGTGASALPAARAVGPQGRPAYEVWLAAVRRVRPDLYNAFNPWDRITTADAVRRLFCRRWRSGCRGRRGGGLSATEDAGGFLDDCAWQRPALDDRPDGAGGGAKRSAADSRSAHGRAHRSRGNKCRLRSCTGAWRAGLRPAIPAAVGQYAQPHLSRPCGMPPEHYSARRSR